MRAWFNGKTLAFQAKDAGSIPAARFKKMILETAINNWFVTSIDIEKN